MGFSRQEYWSGPPHPPPGDLPDPGIKPSSLTSLALAGGFYTTEPPGKPGPPLIYELISTTRWTWVWVNSRSWWWTRRPGVLQFMGLQSRTRLSNWTESFCGKLEWERALKSGVLSWPLLCGVTLVGCFVCWSHNSSQGHSLKIFSFRFWKLPLFFCPFRPKLITVFLNGLHIWK